MLLTVSDPQDITPPTPVSDRLGAESVPNTEAPLVTDWGSAGTKEVRARMPFTTAAAAVVMLERRLSALEDDGGL